MSEHKAAKIAVLVDGAGRRVTLGQLAHSYEPPTIMAATSNDEAAIAAAISASATSAHVVIDAHGAPDWLVGRSPAAAVHIGR